MNRVNKMRLTDAQMLESRVLVEVDIALKEQMERVMGVIDKHMAEIEKVLEYGRILERYDYYKGIYSGLEALKAELEGGNELVLEYGCRYLNSFFECEKGLLISGKCPNNCIYYDDGSR